MQAWADGLDGSQIKALVCDSRGWRESDTWELYPDDGRLNERQRGRRRDCDEGGFVESRTHDYYMSSYQHSAYCKSKLIQGLTRHKIETMDHAHLPDIVHELFEEKKYRVYVKDIIAEVVRVAVAIENVDAKRAVCEAIFASYHSCYLSQCRARCPELLQELADSEFYIDVLDELPCAQPQQARTDFSFPSALYGRLPEVEAAVDGRVPEDGGYVYYWHTPAGVAAVYARLPGFEAFLRSQEKEFSAEVGSLKQVRQVGSDIERMMHVTVRVKIEGSHKQAQVRVVKDFRIIDAPILKEHIANRKALSEMQSLFPATSNILENDAEVASDAGQTATPGRSDGEATASSAATDAGPGASTRPPKRSQRTCSNGSAESQDDEISATEKRRRMS